MAYMLGITYAATLGGCATLLTPVNLAFKGIYETYYLNDTNDPRITYLTFFQYSASISLLNTLLTCLWLQILLMGLLRPKSKDALALCVSEDIADEVREDIRFNYATMGRITGAEIKVTFLLVVFHLALIFRAPYFMKNGWEAISQNKQIGDASPTILIVVLLFVIPSEWKWCKCCRRNVGTSQK